MKIYTDTSLRNFEFWSGAKVTAEYLTAEELDTMDEILGDCYPDGLDETELNDIFWFDDDWIAECLGYENFDEIMAREDVG